MSDFQNDKDQKLKDFLARHNSAPALETPADEWQSITHKTKQSAHTSYWNWAAGLATAAALIALTFTQWLQFFPQDDEASAADLEIVAFLDESYSLNGTDESEDYYNLLGE